MKTTEAKHELREQANISCPHCGGRGSNRGIACGPGRCETSDRQCSTCKGAGRITPELQAKIEEGARMRRDRIARNLTQREEAARLGIDVVTYSQMERGTNA